MHRQLCWQEWSLQKRVKKWEPWFAAFGLFCTCGGAGRPDNAPTILFQTRHLATLHQPQTLTEEILGSFRLMPIFFYIYVDCKYTYLQWETLPTTNPRWFWTMNNRLGKFKRSTSDLSWGFNVEFLFFCCHDLKCNKTHATKMRQPSYRLDELC